MLCRVCEAARDPVPPPRPDDSVRKPVSASFRTPAAGTPPTAHRKEIPTMAQELKDLRVAILADNGFEQSELIEPRKALDAAGARTRVVSPQSDRIRGWNHADWGESVPVDVALDTARPDDYDALLLPGGVMNPDRLRMQPKAVAFVKAFFDAGKPVGAICHGPWLVLEAGAARGRQMTSWPSLQTDLRNAGANWVDRESVVDGNLVTSRKPDDIPAFNRAVIEQFSKARSRQAA
jgi:protease I